MKPGVYAGIPNAEYHGGPGISKSGLDQIERSPMHYRSARDAANDNRPDSKAFFIGGEFHALVLEPDVFVKEYTLAFRRQDAPEAIEDRGQLVAMVAQLNEGRLPKLPTTGSKADQIDRIIINCDNWGTREELEAKKGAELKAMLDAENEKRPGPLSTSGSRHELAELLRANGVEVTLWSDVVAQWEANNGHRKILNPDQWAQVHAMRESVMEHPAASRLLTSVPGKAEVSFYWTDAKTGELCRMRPDWLREDDLIVDLKTTEDASPEGFARSIAKFRYDVQDAFYSDGFEAVTGRRPKGFVFIAVEKKPPYAVGVYVLDAESKELGRAQYRKNLDSLAECVKSNNWPGYGEKIVKVALPAWHANKNAHLLEAQ
ncbi:hypothetical protein [Pseudomonas phage PPpW-3]|uniref:Putative exodeoxyribonuclease 8 PDDEXK-like domain-containing protein n=1 Tax=Pseudomonas phage PPpW-3 TaxID=1279082 RepID=V5YTC9_9CAUD|nr:exonuclease VIII [Pseudomonas phage PPpW-3]BAO20632.1 hypothetical protein [Pseudomonas phage PPpW-3]